MSAINVIRFGFVLPIVALGVVGWITKNGHWANVGWGLLAIVVAGLVALAAAIFVVSDRDVKGREAKRRSGGDPALGRIAADLLSPPQ